MTTANLLNVSSVKGPQVDVSKKLQEEAREVTEIFAAMMNQTVDATSQMVDEVSSGNCVSKTEGTQSVSDSYERYSYKDNQIESAKEHELSAEELEAVEETLEQTENEILSAFSEEYGVDEETLRNLLDDMGLSVLDLLDPKNLVSFVMALTGIASGEELLLDESFLNIMETMDVLSNDLMKELHVDRDGLQDILAQMETIDLEHGDVTFAQHLDTQLENLNDSSEVETLDNQNEVQQEHLSANENQEIQAVKDEQDSSHVSSNAETNEATEATEATENADEVVEGIKVQVEEQEETTDAKTDKSMVEEVESSAKNEVEANLSDNESTSGDSLWNQDTNANQAFVTTSQTSHTVGQVNEMPQMQPVSYFGVDTAQIMEQLAEQIKVVVTPEATSMEMQLNPENLGKIYLNISSEEGVVNAQFYATNEVVKEALEAQIATLRENLTQAGVKVDAIEVTIASHEFERNLEQNQQKPEEQIVQEEKSSRRRNISVEVLDELQGLMTEEETLVAQIMRDNGNTIDFTA